MNFRNIFATFILSYFLVGCGGGGGSSAVGTTSTTTKAQLIDAPVWGVKYINSDGSSGITTKDGTFDYLVGTTKFYVGKVLIGEISKLPSDKKVFIQDFFNDVQRENIDDEKVLKVATFLQSIDSEPINDEVIQISNDTRESFESVDDIVLSNTSKSAKDILLLAGYLAKETATVKEHLRASLTSYGVKVSDSVVDASLGIEKVLPASLKDSYSTYFDRYTKVVAPNGKPIHILAQKTITDEQMIRARNVLEHYLRDYADSLYGSDKSAVANKMADNNAILLLLDGSDDGTNKASKLNGQPLYKNELQVEGGAWYVSQNYEHRDATYEEILHLVHDKGIGIDGEGTEPGALPAFQQEIREAQNYALDNQIWGLNSADWIKELRAENSLTQEYLASVIDAYYGLWGAWMEESETSMWGVYTPRDRDEIKEEDILGQELLNNKFFHPYLTYNARIDASFEGTFYLKFDSNIPYTNHSRYLKDITLLGDKDTNVRVNELDNYITGNNGTNTVVLSGSLSEYTIVGDKNSAKVFDSVDDRDGSENVLKGIEYLRFTDTTIAL